MFDDAYFIRCSTFLMSNLRLRNDMFNKILTSIWNNNFVTCMNVTDLLTGYYCCLTSRRVRREAAWRPPGSSARRPASARSRRGPAGSRSRGRSPSSWWRSLGISAIHPHCYMVSRVTCALCECPALTGRVSRGSSPLPGCVTRNWSRAGGAQQPGSSGQTTYTQTQHTGGCVTWH